MDEVELVPIILGRPFLATARVVIDVHEGFVMIFLGLMDRKGVSTDGEALLSGVAVRMIDLTGKKDCDATQDVSSPRVSVYSSLAGQKSAPGVDRMSMPNADEPCSYVGVAGGSKPKPNKSKANFRSISSKNLRFAFLVVEYYVRNNWGKYGLTRILMNSKGFFFFQFKTSKGLEDVFENGPWMIYNSPIILKKWTMNMRLCKEELTRIPVLVPLIVVTPTVGTPTIEKTNDVFQSVGKKKKKKGKTKSTNVDILVVTRLNRLSGNTTMSNLYAALDDESEEDVENVYNESSNLLHGT
nr:zinc knuckle CX2CX4HX4C [Tanacetum cinerariifolium]